MEKLKAHYDLKTVKQVVASRGCDAFTRCAVKGMEAMGLSEADGLAAVLGLRREMLYKSMTTHADSGVWQDVYHAPCANGKTAYIKLTLREDVVVI